MPSKKKNSLYLHIRFTLHNGFKNPKETKIVPHNNYFYGCFQCRKKYVVEIVLKFRVILTIIREIIAKKNNEIWIYRIPALRSSKIRDNKICYCTLIRIRQRRHCVCYYEQKKKKMIYKIMLSKCKRVFPESSTARSTRDLLRFSTDT